MVKDADILIYLKPNIEKSIAPSAANEWQGRGYVNISIEKNRDGLAGGHITAEFCKEVQTMEDVG